LQNNLILLGTDHTDFTDKKTLSMRTTALIRVIRA